MFEAHPVPQNVTEFQFHLVGDMTIKQFVYLAAGLGTAYLVFALLANKYPIVAYPLILILSASGAALAFLPIQDRPLDHWLGAYFKAIFQPTKRSYKSKILTKEDPLFKSRLQVFLNSRRKAVGPIFKDAKTKSTPFSFSAASIQQAQAQAQAQVAPAPLITQSPAPAAAPPLQPVQSTALPAAAPAPAPAAAPSSIQINTPSITIMAPAQMPMAATPPPPPPPAPPPAAAKPVKEEPEILGTAGLAAIAIPEKKEPVPAPAAPAPAPATMANPVIIKPETMNIVNAPAPARPSTPPPPPPTPNQPAIPAALKPAGKDPVIPTEADLSHTIELAKQVHQVQQKILKTNEQIDSIRSQAAAQDANPKEYLNQFQQLLGELQNLNQQAANLSSQVATLTNEPQKLPSLQADLVVKPKSIPTITLTSIANVINGIVTDSAGNYLDGSIILAHDKSGIPVRALKTNKLGQFVAATPLNNGIYTITIEKDELVFDTIEIELKGEVLKPILITSKPVAEGVAHG